MKSNSANIFFEALAMWWRWHFFQAPRLLFSVWKNFMVFSVSYFSIPVLARALLRPWRSSGLGQSQTISQTSASGAFFSDILLRLQGLCIRTGLMAAGIVSHAVIALAGAVAIFLWIMLPFITTFFIFYAFIF